jgi:hypothetical protein
MWIVLFFLIVASRAPNARADEYTADFECGSGPGVCPVATTEVSFPAPTGFTVDVDGLTFSVGLTAAASPDDSYGWTLGVEANGVAKFVVGDFSSEGLIVTQNEAASLGVAPPGTDIGGGNFEFTSVAAPEPSSLALIVAGVGMLSLIALQQRAGLLSRKRVESILLRP